MRTQRSIARQPLQHLKTMLEVLGDVPDRRCQPPTGVPSCTFDPPSITPSRVRPPSLPAKVQVVLQANMAASMAAGMAAGQVRGESHPAPRNGILALEDAIDEAG